MLERKKQEIKGKRVVISGSGNVAIYAAQKIIELGGKLLTISDSSGYILDEEGITQEKLEWIKEIKEVKRERIVKYLTKYPNAKFIEDKKPWEVPTDIVMPCATQNELQKQDAELLIKNGIIAVGEGANGPSTNEALEVFIKNKIIISPGKASNSGGVATSGLEISQNQLRLSWTA